MTENNHFNGVAQGYRKARQRVIQRERERQR